MKFNKINLLIAGSAILISGVFASIFVNNNDTTNTQNNITQSIEVNNTQQEYTFLDAIAGVKAYNIELVGNPAGVTGNFTVPTESISNGVDYFLKNTQNDKMEDVKINLGEGFILLKVNYKISKDITTPIQAKIIPKLNENKDLELKLDDVKFLDLKISNWIVNLTLKNFIKDWFPEDKNFHIDFNDGQTIIYKDNFEGIDINNLEVKPDGINANMRINFNKFKKQI